MPAWVNTCCRSDGQNSKTSTCVRPGAYGGHAGLPVASSITTGRCTLLTLIGDLPGMNQVIPFCGHHWFGNSPLARQISTRLMFSGMSRTGSCKCGCSAPSASMIWKNSGAAASRPTKAGLPVLSKLPTHTTSTYGPKLPAVHASRNAHDVPVFQYTWNDAGWAPVLSSGRTFWRRMSITMKLAPSLSMRVPATWRSSACSRRGCNTPRLASIA